MHKFPFMPSAKRYNITVSKEKKFLWFRVAKVGTRTIFNHLKENNVHLDVEHAYSIYYAPALFEGYFKFAFVRNPWDRLVSCWQNKIVSKNYFSFGKDDLDKMKSFSEFVNFVEELDIENCDIHLRLQSSLIHLDAVDYLGRIETFNSDASFVFKKLGLPPKKIVSRNVTLNKKPYQEFYDERLIAKVADIYRKDIQMFGYKFQSDSNY